MAKDEKGREVRVFSPTYTGPDRRSGVERRQSTRDRREEIRFELTKEPRRSGKDRRKGSGWDGAPSK